MTCPDRTLNLVVIFYFTISDIARDITKLMFWRFDVQGASFYNLKRQRANSVATVASSLHHVAQIVDEILNLMPLKPDPERSTN